MGGFEVYTRKSETSVTKLTILISDRVRPQVCGAVAHAPVKNDNSNLKSISRKKTVICLLLFFHIYKLFYKFENNSFEMIPN